MFNLTFKKTEPTQLEEEIERLLSLMKEKNPTDDDYNTIADQLTKLYKLKEIDSKTRVSRETMINAGTNLVGILFILHYEHAHVLTSKAASFVMRNVK